MFKALLFWQKNQAIPQAQHSKRRTGAQPKILTKLLRDRELSLFSNLRGGQIFESCLSARHKSLLVGISYRDNLDCSNTQTLGAKRSFQATTSQSCITTPRRDK